MSKKLSKTAVSQNGLLVAGQKLNPTRGYWVCVNENGWVGHWTAAGTKAESIRLLLEGSTLEWSYCRRIKGWRCIKVDIHYLPCN